MKTLRWFEIELFLAKSLFLMFFCVTPTYAGWFKKSYSVSDALDAASKIPRLAQHGPDSKLQKKVLRLGEKVEQLNPRTPGVSVESVYSRYAEQIVTLQKHGKSTLAQAAEGHLASLEAKRNQTWRRGLPSDKSYFVMVHTINHEKRVSQTCTNAEASLYPSTPTDIPVIR